MIPRMFLNELSLKRLAEEISTARERAISFVLTIRECASRGIERVLRTSEDFRVHDIASGYNWYTWLKDSAVDLEIRRYFRSVTTKAPFSEGESEREDTWRDIDCLWQGRPSSGLKAAYVADGLAVSLCSGDEWKAHLLECEVREIIDADVDCRLESVRHASDPKHVILHTEWIRQGIQAAVSNGRELWLHREYFPSLQFSPGVESNLVALPSEALHCVVRVLFLLNSYCLDWHEGERFSPEKIGCPVSPESRQTLEKYTDERTFSCGDGEKRLFSWHAKPGKWRIYFDPAPGPGQLYVGYVGKHLPTVKFG